ncbi:PglD-related sugar-binding protein [Petrocella sp. FN5]|uniref:PglD-related sugar-binding protein n=1 Tax=Petrocella sp. FN5 TaxID=3032002 RepID=UPI0023DB49D8|nr:PglB [Petrocella sp. FN5]MDF1616153.1 PglB [Petrocella sp. FN5]
MMKKNLLILGAGGHGHVVKETAEAMEIFDNIEFLDDQLEKAIGKLNEIESFSKEYRYAFIAIGNNKIRMQWIKKAEELGFNIPVLIHPKAMVSSSTSIYPGSIVTLGAIINANVVVEKGCIISAGSIIDHDSFIGFGTHVDCGAIVKSHCLVLGNSKIESGTIITKDDLPSSEDFIKSKGF